MGKLKTKPKNNKLLTKKKIISNNQSDAVTIVYEILNLIVENKFDFYTFLFCIPHKYLVDSHHLTSNDNGFN